MTDTLPPPVGHLHSNGDFCQDRAVDAPVWWPVSLYTDDQVIAVRDAAVAAERERICAAIKAEDDYMVDRDYMLDSDDCIKVARGQWVRPE